MGKTLIDQPLYATPISSNFLSASFISLQSHGFTFHLLFAKIGYSSGPYCNAESCEYTGLISPTKSWLKHRLLAGKQLTYYDGFRCINHPVVTTHGAVLSHHPQNSRVYMPFSSPPIAKNRDVNQPGRVIVIVLTPWPVLAKHFPSREGLVMTPPALQQLVDNFSPTSHTIHLLSLNALS